MSSAALRLVRQSALRRLSALLYPAACYWREIFTCKLSLPRLSKMKDNYPFERHEILLALERVALSALLILAVNLASPAAKCFISFFGLPALRARKLLLYRRLDEIWCFTSSDQRLYFGMRVAFHVWHLDGHCRSITFDTDARLRRVATRYVACTLTKCFHPNKHESDCRWLRCVQMLKEKETLALISLRYEYFILLVIY